MENTYRKVEMIYEIAELLHEAASIMEEIGDLTEFCANNSRGANLDKENESCSFYDIYWRDDVDKEDDDVPLMVMIAVPGNGFSVIKSSKAERDYPNLFPGRQSAKNLIPIPGTENVYFTYASQSKRTINGKTYVTSPVMIMKIDEKAGEFISPDAWDLYLAANHFIGNSTEIRTEDGRLIPAFCLD